MSRVYPPLPVVLDWRPMEDFPRDGRTVLLMDLLGNIEFARYEPEAGLQLKIVSGLGASQLGTLASGLCWAEARGKTIFEWLVLHRAQCGFCGSTKILTQNPTLR